MRIEYPGTIYHLLSRGDRREAIFLDDGDRHDFIKTLALLERLHGRLGPNHFGATRRKAGAAPAEQIIAAELRRLGLAESHVSVRAKTDPDELAIAARLRRETTLTIKEIAKRLRMRSRKSIGFKLYQSGKNHQ
ncbi:MAG TPA: hypothetical protein VH595_20710 [Verrucomicrobiae bacterium]|jgi:enoyl-CoA hydratase/carnithine racemase|nr:hypothetical protein [Verrucomicrobiae bacterium]